MTTVYDELADSVHEIRELSAAQVNEWLNRRHGWAQKHVCELGGYFDGRWRFPIHAIKAWQRSQAEAYAQERAS